ncbi:MAG: hypothetical protein HUU26_01035 [Gemmatimonadaceae bacterium]|nr:hypothetical protein [Planctomycetota bacterium]NUQ10899.1 hypothetical protein [Gemmatimonadaceae bacterium]
MGVAVIVGFLLDEEEGEALDWSIKALEALNRVLASNRLPPHLEPAGGPPIESRSPLDSLPYSYIHYLRRLYVRWRAAPSFTADMLPADGDPTEDPLLVAAYSNRSEPSHLVAHSDCLGFYVPMDFPRVLVADPRYDDYLGGMVGSSHRLRAELESIAPILGIRLHDGRLDDAEIERLFALTAQEEGSFREIETWVVLHEAARLSIENEAVVAFC